MKLQYVVCALGDLEAWPKWHPNIDSISILDRIDEENSVNIMLTGRVSGHDYQIFLRVHVFQVDSKTFVAIQSINDPRNAQKKKSSLLSLLSFSPKPPAKYDYLLFTFKDSEARIQPHSTTRDPLYQHNHSLSSTFLTTPC